MPDEGELDRNPPADDTFFEKAQKDINSKAIPTEEKSTVPDNNGATSSLYGGLVNSIITGFLLLSVILQVILTSILKCSALATL